MQGKGPGVHGKTLGWPFSNHRGVIFPSPVRDLPRPLKPELMFTN